MNFAAEDPTSKSVAQASAPQLIFMPGLRIARCGEFRRVRPCTHSSWVVSYLER
jgi:hypothetical protein